MGQVAAQADRDVAIYRAWVEGARQVDLAEQYGLAQQTISDAIGRVQASLPPVEKDAEVRRAAELCDELLATFLPQARAGKTGASREARGWLQLKARWLGIDRREVNVQVEHTGTVQHEPVESVRDVLDDWRRRGLLRPRAEITRLDGGG
jgi:hypothetical protein